jgi:hypothetical protein
MILDSELENARQSSCRPLVGGITLTASCLFVHTLNNTDHHRLLHHEGLKLLITSYGLVFVGRLSRGCTE